MSRKMIDCRDYPSDKEGGKQCSLVLAGEEEEVLKAAAQHSVSVHGMEDTPEAKELLHKALKDEPSDWFAKKPSAKEGPRPTLN